MKRQIFVTIVAIAALALAVLGTPLVVILENQYWNESLLELQRTAAVAASDLPGPSPVRTRDLEALPPDPDTNLALYGPDGRLRQGTGPADADPIVRRALDGDAADGLVDDDIVVAFPISRDARITGAARASLAEDIIDRRALAAGAAIAGLAAAVLGTAAVAARWQTRRLTRPLDRLTAAARQLADGDLAVRTTTSGLAEIDATAAALDRTAERLGGLLERERRFSADVSHQLRTPLTGLRLQLENAQSTPGIDIRSAVADALASVDRLETTIDDLLSLARDTTTDLEPTTVAALLDELDRHWRNVLTERGRRLVITRPPIGAARLRFPHSALRQTLDVLVGNGAEHGSGTVRVTATVNGATAAIEVSDEGPGLPGDPELAFSRRADRRTDHGIGLSLARSLVEAEGGHLSYRATPRPTFCLTVPTMSPVEPHDPASDTAPITLSKT